MRPNLTPPEEPKDAEGYNRRGNQYSRNGAYEQAIADYTQALELDGPGRCLVQPGRLLL